MQLNFKRWLLITKNRHLKLVTSVFSLRMGKCKSLGSMKLFLWYASWLYRASVLFFFILNSPQDAPSAAATVADGLMGGKICCLPRWWATFFVYWSGRQHFFVHTVHAQWQDFVRVRSTLQNSHCCVDVGINGTVPLKKHLVAFTKSEHILCLG